VSGKKRETWIYRVADNSGKNVNIALLYGEKTAQKLTFHCAKFKFQKHGKTPLSGAIHPWGKNAEIWHFQSSAKKKNTEIWPFSVIFSAAILAPGDCTHSEARWWRKLAASC
jgi:hypothetical protein